MLSPGMFNPISHWTLQFVHLYCRGACNWHFSSLRNWHVQDLNVTSLFWEIRDYKVSLFCMSCPELLYHELRNLFPAFKLLYLSVSKSTFIVHRLIFSKSAWETSAHSHPYLLFTSHLSLWALCPFFPCAFASLWETTSTQTCSQPYSGLAVSLGMRILQLRCVSLFFLPFSWARSLLSVLCPSLSVCVSFMHLEGGGSNQRSI